MRLWLFLLISCFSFKAFADLDGLAFNYLKLARANQPAAEIKKSIFSHSLDSVVKELNDDKKKKAFWINLYNARVQETLRNNPHAWQEKGNFFNQKVFLFKDFQLSLDDVENGILRKSQFKYGLGYVQKWYVPAYEKALRLQIKDWRIHFALSFGTESSPSIQFYESVKVFDQLEQAVINFVKEDVKFNPKKNEVKLSRIFLWFNGDFGGPRGIKSILTKYMRLPVDKRTELTYKEFDWSIK